MYRIQRLVGKGHRLQHVNIYILYRIWIVAFLFADITFFSI